MLPIERPDENMSKQSMMVRMWAILVGVILIGALGFNPSPQQILGQGQLTATPSDNIRDTITRLITPGKTRWSEIEPVLVSYGFNVYFVHDGDHKEFALFVESSPNAGIHLRVARVYVKDDILNYVIMYPIINEISNSTLKETLERLGEPSHMKITVNTDLEPGTRATIILYWEDIGQYTHFDIVKNIPSDINNDILYLCYDNNLPITFLQTTPRMPFDMLDPIINTNNIYEYVPFTSTMFLGIYTLDNLRDRLIYDQCLKTLYAGWYYSKPTITPIPTITPAPTAVPGNELLQNITAIIPGFTPWSQVEPVLTAYKVGILPDDEGDLKGYELPINNYLGVFTPPYTQSIKATVRLKEGIVEHFTIHVTQRPDIPLKLDMPEAQFAGFRAVFSRLGVPSHMRMRLSRSYTSVMEVYWQSTGWFGRFEIDINQPFDNNGGVLSLCYDNYALGNLSRVAPGTSEEAMYAILGNVAGLGTPFTPTMLLEAPTLEALWDQVMRGECLKTPIDDWYNNPYGSLTATPWATNTATPTATATATNTPTPSPTQTPINYGRPTATPVLDNEILETIAGMVPGITFWSKVESALIESGIIISPYYDGESVSSISLSISDPGRIFTPPYRHKIQVEIRLDKGVIYYFTMHIGQTSGPYRMDMPEAQFAGFRSVFSRLGVPSHMRMSASTNLVSVMEVYWQDSGWFAQVAKSIDELDFNGGVLSLCYDNNHLADLSRVAPGTSEEAMYAILGIEPRLRRPFTSTMVLEAPTLEAWWEQVMRGECLKTPIDDWYSNYGAPTATLWATNTPTATPTVGGSE
jgi:hypothetical protein